MTYMKRKGVSLPLTVAVMTDYTCIPFWEETDCDYYIVPHRDLLETCVKRGIPREKLLPFGIPVSRRFRLKADKEKAREYLGFPKDRKIFLLMGGSMGAGDLEKLTEKLWKEIGGLEGIAVICGSNKKIFQKLKKRYEEEKDVFIIGKTRQMELYMKACDIIYTKPGGLTSTEAAVSRIPIVHTAPIPGCESANRRFFVSHKMSIAPRSAEEQVEEGIRLLESPEQVRAMEEAQKNCISGRAAEKIVDFLEERSDHCEEKGKRI